MAAVSSRTPLPSLLQKDSSIRNSKSIRDQQAFQKIRRVQQILLWKNKKLQQRQQSLLSPSPSFRISNDKDEVKLSMDLPGVYSKDVVVTVEIIAGTRRIPPHNNTYFRKQFRLSHAVVDTARLRANLSRGVLVVTAPKRSKVGPTRIVVSEEPHPEENGQRMMMTMMDHNKQEATAPTVNKEDPVESDETTAPDDDDESTVDDDNDDEGIPLYMEDEDEDEDEEEEELDEGYNDDEDFEPDDDKDEDDEVILLTSNPADKGYGDS
eukprot:CAMPEP_0116861932 /NCGR_PEP_ID=MMETSP0418-20121206/23343_1 /TAXON_ID=1158023 /ORGANISM="Astrosyne radiata, Strain 13vi08-1A" /LENGTH=265 /DNA_ID=CAMNT_0004496701 /DNA_START=34 /DNA_END=832 /DNA_ORIENTATION=+